MDENTGKILLVSGIAAVLIIAFFTYGLPSQPNINEDWLVVIQSQNNMWETVSGGWIQQKYGCSIVGFDTVETNNIDLNQHGLNLLFLGGSGELAEQAPWTHTGWPTLTVMRPDDQPVVYWDVDQPDEAWIVTSTANWVTMENGVTIHDYGFVTKGYDKTLDRWIIVCAGWSAWATASGSKLLVQDFDEVKNMDGYLIYEVPLELQDQLADPATWMLSQFSYVIVARG